jgi:hypothetical protein
VSLAGDGTVLDVLSGYKDNEFSIVVDAVKKAGMEDVLGGRELGTTTLSITTFSITFE